MNTYNRVVLLGNVGGNANFTTTRAGASVYNCQLATNDVWFTTEGERKDEAQWHHLTAYNKLAEQMDRALAKGDTVLVEGRLHYKPRPDGGVYSEVIVEAFNRIKKNNAYREDDRSYTDSDDRRRDSE